jgi:hypothetical protein
MSDEGLVAEFPRKIPHKAVPIGFLVFGLGMAIGGAVSYDPAQMARNGLLLAFGALFLVTGVGLWLDAAKKTRLNERIRLFGDRIEVASSKGTTSYPFSELKSLEGKVTTYQQTGERVHGYKLAFGSGVVELIGGGELVGIGEQTGSLLAEHTGRRMEPWL